MIIFTSGIWEFYENLQVIYMRVTSPALTNQITVFVTSKCTLTVAVRWLNIRNVKTRVNGGRGAKLFISGLLEDSVVTL